MSPLLQNLIVLALVMGAAAFLVRRLVRKPKSDGGCGGGCGCSGRKEITGP